jgi:hypothetical protein
MFSLVFMPDMSEKYAIDQLINGKSDIYTFAGVLEMNLEGSDRGTEKQYEGYANSELFVCFDLVFRNLTDQYTKFIAGSIMTKPVLLKPYESKTVETKIKICVAEFIGSVQVDCEEVEFKISRRSL